MPHSNGWILMSNTSTPYPSDYPPAKQTLEIRENQTREAALYLPQPPPISKPLPPTLSPLPPATPRGTPAGAGVITDEIGMPPSSVRRAFDLGNTVWYEEVGNHYIIVFVGVMVQGNPSQGILFVYRSNSLKEYEIYQTPNKAGRVQIVDAQGERLILLSESGVKFYFDVPGERFVSSLTEVVPTITPE
ncbi:MAG: hypothetical protein AAB658_14625, partial [Chloroflexota bacterium]